MDRPAGNANSSTYQGSYLLSPVANMAGLPIDQLNFLFSEVLALIFAICYRRFLPPKPSNTFTRHLIGMIKIFYVV